MGALTSKPYSYNFRPWELEKFTFYDFLNSTLSTIKVELHNNNISRILPVYDKNLSENYISNKVRFFFDFYKNQKMLHPTLKVNANYLNLSTYRAKKLLLLHFFKQNNITLLLNKNFTDLTAAANFSTLTKFNNFNLLFDNNLTLTKPINSFDLSLLSYIKSYAIKVNFIFLSTNLRFESPLFLLKLKNFNKKTNLVKLFNVGVKFNNLPFIKNLGQNVPLTLKKLLYGKINVKKLYNNFTTLKFFTTSTTTNNVDLSLLAKFDNLKLNNLIPKFDNVYSLLSSVGEVNLTYLNITESKKSTSQNLLLNFNNDTLAFKTDAFKVYFGHNATLTNLSTYNLFIPIKNIFEDYSSFKYPLLKKIITTTPIFETTKIKSINFYLTQLLTKLNLTTTSPKLYTVTVNNFAQTYFKNFYISSLSYNYFVDNVYTYGSKNLNLAYNIYNSTKKKNGIV